MSSDNDWKILNEKLLQKTRVFDLWVQRMLFPDGKSADDFFFLKTADWVNVIPITPDNNVVMVEQFRHGTNVRSLETPGGLVEPGADGLQTAIKELAEETGYEAEEMLSLGQLSPNPAMLRNACHVFYAKNATPKHKLNLEPAEDISVHLVPLKNIPEMILSGEIKHSIVAAAFYLLHAKLNCINSA